MDIKEFYEKNFFIVNLTIGFITLMLLIYFVTKSGFISPDGIISNKKLSIRSDIDKDWNIKEFEKAIASFNS